MNSGLNLCPTKSVLLSRSSDNVLFFFLFFSFLFYRVFSSAQNDNDGSGQTTKKAGQVGEILGLWNGSFSTLFQRDNIIDLLRHMYIRPNSVWRYMNKQSVTHLKSRSPPTLPPSLILVCSSFFSRWSQDCSHFSFSHGKKRRKRERKERETCARIDVSVL